MFMMTRNQFINGKKHDVSAAFGVLYANRTLVTKPSTWARSLTFIFE